MYRCVCDGCQSITTEMETVRGGGVGGAVMACRCRFTVAGEVFTAATARMDVCHRWVFLIDCKNSRRFLIPRRPQRCPPPRRADVSGTRRTDAVMSYGRRVRNTHNNPTVAHNATASFSEQHKSRKVRSCRHRLLDQRVAQKETAQREKKKRNAE